MDSERNVFDEPLEPCSMDPLTGFFRTGACMAGPDDTARHLVCCEMTADFLVFSKSVGNDLSTPRPEFAFPGLKDGDHWCLVAPRWVEALKAGMAPRVFLRSTHQAALRYTTIEALKAYALDLA
ncbi:MAG: DUF2237 domain-containing protein [Devosia sp.]